MLIRREAAIDAAAISRVHASAFQAEGPDVPVEVRLVEELRRSNAWLPRLSLVAVIDGEVIGHVVCTRASLGSEAAPVLGLGPVGVLAKHQRRGIGSALIHAVIEAAEALDEPLIGLLGAPDFYRRFGFAPAADLGIDAPDPGWGEYFQARPLASYSPDLRGRFSYAAPFDGL